MKKLIFLLFILGFASVSFAQEVKNDFPLKVNVSGVVYGTYYQSVIKDTSGDYSAFRIRPVFTYINSDIEAVLMLEYDAVFGARSEIDDTAKSTSEFVGLSADRKSLEVTRAYLKSKVDGITGLSIKGGIDNYDFPLVYGDNTPILGLTFSAGIVNLNLYMMKPSEGELNKSKDDSQVYIADVTFKIGEVSIRPAFFAYQCEKEATVGQYKDSIGYIPALSMNIPVGTFGLDMTGVFVTGKDKMNDTDYRSFAFDIAPYFQPTSNLKITTFFTMISGDDDITTGKDNSFLNGTIDGGGAGINSFRLYIIEDAGSFTTYSDVTTTGTYTNYNGYMAFGLSANVVLGPLKVKFQGAYVQAARVASGQKKDMGIEFDTNFSYSLTSSSTMYVEGAYLKAGKYYDTTYIYDDSTTTGTVETIEKQNPYYLNIGVKYSI